MDNLRQEIRRTIHQAEVKGSGAWGVSYEEMHEFTDAATDHILELLKDSMEGQALVDKFFEQVAELTGEKFVPWPYSTAIRKAAGINEETK